MKTKIKIALLMLAISVVLTLQSCNRWNVVDINKEAGLENFDTNQTQFDLHIYLFPDGDFIDRFEYVDGNYWYRIYGGVLGPYYQEYPFVYMRYDNETYSKAKAYAIENLILSEDPFYEYNGYVFYFNNTATKKNTDNFKHTLNSENYPYNFLSFSYNDSLNTLVFFGMYVGHGDSLRTEIDAVADDWPAFLEKYYGEWYSFS